ncbi:MAG: ATP-binding protein [Bacteroidaceae bacterium]
MFERELTQQLRHWRNNPHRKPLVLRGARQVGKTTLIKEFGKEFDHFIPLNLEKKDAELFRQFNNVNDIWQFLCLKNHIAQDKNKAVLLFIDEIQEEPNAVALLRYFYEDLPWVYVIAAGSRLHSLMKQRISFPVGRVEHLTLRPCSFIEFVNAKEGKQWTEMLRNISVPDFMHEEMISTFNNYSLVGGMPEAVDKYLESHDLTKLSPIFNSLLRGYNEDAEKYARNTEQVKILRHILKTAWFSAAETITFSGFGNSSYNSSQIHDGMDLLERAYLLSLDYPITSTSAPALPAIRRSPKLVMVDTGLCNFLAGIQLEYLQNKNLLDTWRGRAAEHVVAQELRIVLDKHYREQQYFWIRDKKGSTAEVDFIWQEGTNIIPIEIKSGTNSHLRSLNTFVNLCDHDVVAVRIWSNPLSIQDIKTPAPHNKPFRLINLPFYYTGQIDTIIKKYGLNPNQSLER